MEVFNLQSKLEWVETFKLQRDNLKILLKHTRTIRTKHSTGLS